MGLRISNNGTSTLDGAITADATTLSVQAADAALFPSPGVDEWFPLTVVAGDGDMEIMRATARAGSVITVTRAQEGTAAAAFAAGARVDLRMTAGAFAILRDTLAGVVPGVSGLAILAAVAAGDVRNYLDVAPVVSSRAELRALDPTKDAYAFFEFHQWDWDGGDLSPSILGSAINSSAVASATDTITSVAHGLKTGNCVITTTAVNGLALNTKYYVIKTGADSFKLASNFENAMAGIVFDLTADTAVTVKRHYDPMQGIYVTPDSDISGASGARVRLLDDATLRPKQFQADITGTNYCDEALAGMIDYFRKQLTANGLYKAKIDGSGAQLRHKYSVNCTSLRGRGHRMDHLHFLSECLDEIGVDFTDTNGINGDDIICRGHPTLIPSVGILFARRDDGAPIPFPTAASNNFGKVEAYGTFKIMGFMNAAAEVFHVDVLITNNNYWSNLATCDGFAGHTDVFVNFGGMPTSRYETIGAGSQSAQGVTLDMHNPQRSPAYGYTILGISKTNPAVVTIASADAVAGNANFGLANGNTIFLDATTGTDPAWHATLGYKVFTVANINTAAGTLELAGVDASGIAGTFASGILRNNTGPHTVLGQLGQFEAKAGYGTCYSDAYYRADVRGDTDWNWQIAIKGRHETAADHFMRIVGNGVSNRIRGLKIESDNAAILESVFTIGGVTGAGDIVIDDLEAEFGHEAQTPTIGMFDNPGVVKLNGGRIVVPSSAFVDNWSDFKNGQCFARWEYGNQVRDDGAPIRKLWGSNARVDSTGAIAKTAVVTHSVPGWFLQAGDRLIVEHLWSHTGSTNAKTPRVELNIFAFFNQAIVGATQVASRYRTVIDIIDTTNQIGGPINIDAYGEIAAALVAGTANIANAQNLVISAEIAAAGEELDLRSYSVFLERLAA